MALGRGLGALFSSGAGKSQEAAAGFAASIPTTHGAKLWQVPLSEIHSATTQPRKKFTVETLTELAASIKEHGVLQPLLVAERADGGYELVAGERRLRAARQAGLTTVPVLVKKLAPRQKVELALIENIQRENLTPLEEAFAYRRLMEEFSLTQEAVAERVGKSRPVIANMVRLLELPADAQQALEEGKISSAQARTLLSLKDRANQRQVLQALLSGQKHLTVRDLEAAARSSRAPRPSRRDPNLEYLERALEQALGSRVRVTERGGRGAITIFFYSLDEFRQLMKKLPGAPASSSAE